jgi:ferrous iron transport protein A
LPEDTSFKVYQKKKEKCTFIPVKTLDKLKIGESGVIKSLTKRDLALKLIEMGCLPGEKVTLIKIAPLGDPIAIEVSGYELSMRKDEASTVVIED